jgi:hypothetical protein
MERTVLHLSHEGAIREFIPRPSPSRLHDDRPPMVWGIDSRLQHNYLFPRECPRVTFYAGPASMSEDIERFMGTTTARYAVYPSDHAAVCVDLRIPRACSGCEDA